MRPYVEPIPLTQEQRFREIAHLLAIGVRRLLSRPVTPNITSENPPDLSQNSLEVSPETRLSVQRG